MKILIVDLGSKFNTVGGQARIASILNKGLGKYFQTYYLGYQTEYSKGIKNPIFLERPNKLGLSVRRSRFSEMWPIRFAYNFMVVRSMRDIDKPWLLKKIADIKPDVIIANSIQDINLLKFLKRNGIDFKSVYIDHGSVSTSISGYLSKEGIPLTVGTGIDSGSLSEKKRKFFNFYDLNIALNRIQLSSMMKFTNKAKLIPNGMDVRSKKNRKKEQELRRKYGINSNDFVILYIGRMFDRQKNVSALIRAFKEIKDQRIKLLLVGDGPSLKDYKVLAEGDGRVIFAGSANDADINAIYNISSLFVLPSFWEGFSLTVIEAASHSLPLALSRNAYVQDLRGKDLSEIVSFDPNDEEEIRQCLLSLSRSQILRKKAIDVSIKIKRKFTEKNMIDGYREALEELA